MHNIEFLVPELELSRKWTSVCNNRPSVSPLPGCYSLAPSCSASNGLSLLPPNGPEMAVTDQFAPLFIPETERERFETGKQCDGLHGLKQRFRVVAFLQMIIRNPRAQVM